MITFRVKHDMRTYRLVAYCAISACAPCVDAKTMSATLSDLKRGHRWPWNRAIRGGMSRLPASPPPRATRRSAVTVR